jgi:hypothetical protein
MKIIFWMPCFVCLQFVAANAQILRYEFNEGVGTQASSSGLASDSLQLRDALANPTTGLWGAAGSGTSGRATDLALNLTSATGMGSGFKGPNAFLPSLSSGSTVNQFTLTGWFDPSENDLGRAAFLTLRNGSNSATVTGLSGGPVGARNRLRLIIDNGDTFPEVDATGDFESQWSTTGAWAFFAIAYDGPHSAVRFYSGDLAGPTSLSATVSDSAIVFPLGGSSIWVAADPVNSNPFKGLLDDFRIYGSALDLSQIEQVRLSAVPEPHPVALVILGALLIRVSRPCRSGFSLSDRITRSIRRGPTV